VDWVIQNEMQTQRYLELLSITFGDQSTGKSLFDLRRQLYTKYKLDDPAQSRAEQEHGLQQFEKRLEQQLQQASPEAKSMWWGDSHLDVDGCRLPVLDDRPDAELDHVPYRRQRREHDPGGSAPVGPERASADCPGD